MNIDGACHCGNITWKAIANPDMVAVCYCTDCQTFGSSAFQYTARIKRDDFELTSGKLKELGKLADSGNERYYSFCGDCGSGIHTSNIDGRGVIGSTGWLPPEGSVTSQTPNLVLLGTRLGIRGKRDQTRQARVADTFYRDRLSARVPQLSPGLIDGNRNGVRQIQASTAWQHG